MCVCMCKKPRALYETERGKPTVRHHGGTRVQLHVILLRHREASFFSNFIRREDHVTSDTLYQDCHTTFQAPAVRSATPGGP